MTTKERCPESYCPACGDRHVHQGARRINESGSPFGQWVHDELPRTFTAGDVDMYVRVFYRHEDGEAVLLRWIEHKGRGQKFELPQRKALADFASIIEHAINCPDAPLRLDTGSGVYVVRSGFVDGLPVEVTVERVTSEADESKWTKWQATAEKLARWIPRRRGPRAA